VHSSPAAYISTASRLVLNGNYDAGQYSWEIGNHAKWININPSGNHSKPLKTVSCNSTLTSSGSSNMTAVRQPDPNGWVPDIGDFNRYHWALPTSLINIPGLVLGSGRLQYAPGPIYPSSNTSGGASSLGSTLIWFDIGVDGGRCNITGACTYIYRQSLLAFSEEAQTIMNNHLTDGDNTTGIPLTGTPLTGTLTTQSLRMHVRIRRRVGERWQVPSAIQY